MITTYINYLRFNKKFTENTCRNYEHDLRDFANWASRNIADARWSKIQQSDVEAYVRMLTQAGRKPATINRRLASLRMFYEQMAKTYKDLQNPARYVSRQKIDQNLPNTLPTDRVCEAAARTDDQTGTAIRLFLESGIRAQELLDLRIEETDLGTASAIVRGKGGKERKVYFSQETANQLRELGSMRSAGYWFTKWENQRELRHDIYYALRTTCKSQWQLSPHALRHTFATELTADGMATAQLQTLLGHASIKTTQKYIDAAGTRTEMAYRAHAGRLTA